MGADGTTGASVGASVVGLNVGATGGIVGITGAAVGMTGAAVGDAVVGCGVVAVGGRVGTVVGASVIVSTGGRVGDAVNGASVGTTGAIVGAEVPATGAGVVATGADGVALAGNTVTVKFIPQLQLLPFEPTALSANNIGFPSAVASSSTNVYANGLVSPRKILPVGSQVPVGFILTLDILCVIFQRKVTVSPTLALKSGYGLPGARSTHGAMVTFCDSTNRHDVAKTTNANVRVEIMVFN
jgi:hypothetical protein